MAYPYILSLLCLFQLHGFTLENFSWKCAVQPWTTTHCSLLLSWFCCFPHLHPLLWIVDPCHDHVRYDQHIWSVCCKPEHCTCPFNEQYFRHFPNFLSLALANTRAIQTASFVLSSCAVKQAEYLCGHKLLSKVSPSPICHMLPL